MEFHHIIARTLIVGLAILTFYLEGMRLPGYALEIIQGTKTYLGTTNLSMRALKFWLAVCLHLMLPIAALLMLTPRRYALAASLAIFILAAAWWLAVMGFNITNEIDRGRGFPSLLYLVKNGLFLGLISVLPCSLAYWLLRRERPLD